MNANGRMMDDAHDVNISPAYFEISCREKRGKRSAQMDDDGIMNKKKEDGALILFKYERQSNEPLARATCDDTEAAADRMLLVTSPCM